MWDLSLEMNSRRSQDVSSRSTKCTNKLVIVLFVYVFSMISGLHAAKIIDQCQKINSCSCRNSNGTIDLSPLAFQNNTPRFEIRTPTMPNYTFYWNPCYPFTYPTGGSTDKKCTDVAFCMTNATNFDNLGGQSNVIFTRYPDYPNHVVIKYTYQPVTTQGPILIRHAFVYLECSHYENPGVAMAAGEVTKGTFMFAYRGVYACPVKPRSHLLSAGSILLIIFFTFIGVYLLFGVIYQKFALNESGWRLIPNNDLWSDMLIDISAGCSLTVSCCKKPRRVERYDKM